MRHYQTCERCVLTSRNRELLCDYGIRVNSNMCVYNTRDSVVDTSLEVIDDAAYYLRERGFTDPYSLLYAYSYMLMSGCFSLGKHFKYNNKVAESGNLLYLNVFTGTGSCRHVSDFYRILVNAIDSSYSPFFVRGYNSALTEDFNPRRKTPNVKENIQDILEFLKVKLSNSEDFYSLKNYGNHCCVSINTSGIVILQDPLNLYTYSFDGSEVAKLIAGSGKFYICGLTKNAIADYDKDSALKELNSMVKSKRKAQIEEVMGAYYRVVDYFDYHKKELADFTMINSHKILDINEELNQRLTLHK